MQSEEADKMLAWNIANLAVLCYVCKLMHECSPHITELLFVKIARINEEIYILWLELKVQKYFQCCTVQFIFYFLTSNFMVMRGVHGHCFLCFPNLIVFINSFKMSWSLSLLYMALLLLKRRACGLLNYQCNWFIVETKETWKQRGALGNL